MKSLREYSPDFILGVRPVETQYIILYYSVLVPGIQWCFTWSYESLDRVRADFYSDFADEQPRVAMIMPVDEN